MKCCANLTTSISAFSLILSMAGKINFQTDRAILLHVEFQEFQAILNGNKRYYTR